MRIGIGHSDNADAREAALEAVREAKRAVPEPQMALAFGAITRDQKGFHDALCSELDPAILLGGSSYAEASNRGVTKGGAAVFLLSMERGSVRIAGTGFEGGARERGERLGRALGKVSGPGKRPFALAISGFADGRDEELLKALAAESGVFPVFGGLACGDHDKGIGHPDFYKAYAYNGPELGSLAARAAVLDLPEESFTTAFGFGHGWEPVGPPSVLTRCDGSRVYEVDGVSVFDYYRRLLGRRGDGDLDTLTMQRYAISLEVGGDAKRSILKLPVKVDAAAGWMEFLPAEDLQGRTVRMILSSRLGLIEGARRAARECLEALGGKRPSFVLMVSCCTRSAILHSQGGNELDAVREVFGAEVPIFGFYSGGEYVPYCRTYPEIVDGSCPAWGSHYHASTLGLFAVAAEEPVEAVHVPAGRIDIWNEGRLRGMLAESEANLDRTEDILAKLSRKSYEDSERIRRQNDLIHAYTPHNVWREVGEIAARGEGELHNAEFEGCFLFMDVKGFTSYSEAHPAKQVVTVLNEIFDPATDIIYRRGGDVDKFIGDCIFAAFPGPKEAVAAGKEILNLFKTCKENGHPFSVRIGINGGRAVRANVGSRSRREYTYIGDAVNLSQRLESNCVPGRLLLSEGVFKECGESFAEALPREVQVKGKKDPVRAYDCEP